MKKSTDYQKNHEREYLQREAMQRNLLLIRKSVGWSAEVFGDKIGVTRQTINSLEAQKKGYSLSKTQYLAMRYVLDKEIRNNPEGTKVLASILEALVDHPEAYKTKDKEELLSKANMLAPSILAGTSSREDASAALVQICGIAAAAALAFIGGMLDEKKSLKSLKK